MDYNKLVWNLRKKAFNYEGEKSTQFDRVLKEAIKRKVIAYSQTDENEERRKAIISDSIISQSPF